VDQATPTLQPVAAADPPPLGAADDPVPLQAAATMATTANIVADFRMDTFTLLLNIHLGARRTLPVQPVRCHLAVAR